MTAYDKALYYLSMREHCRKELETKLRTKGYNACEIEAALDRLEEENFLSDARYAEVFIRLRLRKNPEGKEIIIMRLIEKGVSPSLARNSVTSYFEENSTEIEAIYSSLRARAVSQKGEEKARAYLFRKGIKFRD